MLVTLVIVLAAVVASPATSVRAQDIVVPGQIPGQPADPAAAKAYGVFDQACASCHQKGRIKTPGPPAAGLGNILDLEALARNPAWVRPGNADASPLYNAIQSRAMPLPPPGETSAATLTATDLGVIRDWIEQMPPAPVCDPQNRVTAATIAAQITKAAANRDVARAGRSRFISLAPLRNGCATPEALDAARQAVTWMLNSISLGLEPVKLAPLDPDGLLLEVDLTAIGWDGPRWDQLALHAPAAPFTVFSAEARSALGTATPVVNADWFVDAASRAPLYYELLGTPETLASLFTGLSIDMTNTQRGAADRIGLKTSNVARGNRLLERRPFVNGSAWIASEFAPTAGRPDLFDMTVASATAKPTGANKDGRTPVLQPSPDATLVHFDLPNGFPAFFTANANGMRVNDVPHSILKDDSHPGARIATANSCLGCHATAPLALANGRSDDLRARLQTDPALSKEQRDTLLALHSDPTGLQRKIDEDRTRFQRVMTAAGIDPSRQFDGQDLIPALMHRYQRAITLSDLADLADMEPQALVALGKTADAITAGVLNRIVFGPVPRAEAEAVLSAIAVKRGLLAPGAGGTQASGAAAVPVTERADSAPMQLVLSAVRPVFQSGDLLVVSARANTNCYLTLLSLDARGRATVLYPNESDANNFIDAGHQISIPGDKAPYQFRVREKGQESLLGICSTSARPVDGMLHNFEMQRFTELGDYRAFLNRSWDSWRPGETKAPAPPKSTSRRGSDSSKSTEQPPPSKPEVQARTAIRIRIE